MKSDNRVIVSCLEVNSLENKKVSPELVKVVVALRRAGYDPLDQLTGYLESGDPSYITRQNGARDIIEKIDKEEIRKFLNSNNRE